MEARTNSNTKFIKLFRNSSILVLTLVSVQGLTQPASSGKTLKDTYKNAFLIGVAVTPAITSGADKTSQDIVIKH